MKPGIAILLDKFTDLVPDPLAPLKVLPLSAFFPTVNGEIWLKNATNNNIYTREDKWPNSLLSHMNL